MLETVKIIISPNKNKKYKAILYNKKTQRVRTLHFGANGYEQYADSTHIKKYKKYNHCDRKRRQKYFLRFSGVKTKTEALKKEWAKSNGLYTPKILSHIYLW